VSFFGTRRTRTGRSFEAGRISGGTFKSRKGEGFWIYGTKKKKKKKK